MPVEIDLGVLLQNVRVALVNGQYQHAQFLLEYAMGLSERCSCRAQHGVLSCALGLHRGRVRPDNEDCLFALQGMLPVTGEVLGLFVVADGMGGHAYGQQAASLAIQTMVEQLLPHFVTGSPSANWEALLANSIQQANRAVYLRNQAREQATGTGGEALPAQRSDGRAATYRMGTTVTAVLLIGKTAYLANVGDSRIYLYAQGLRRMTRDHSTVAKLLADGVLTDEEEIYTHRQRNQITRAVGTHCWVEVDTFVLPLPSDDVILLLCSDGLWESTRDRAIEQVLAAPGASAAAMSHQLVTLANVSGGTDNIGCIVIQRRSGQEISVMDTIILDPHKRHPSLSVPS